MPLPAEYDALLSKFGVSLASLGFNEVALSRSDALAAIDELRAAGWPILGGDVYYLRNRIIESSHASWHAEPNEAEQPQDFLRRSCEIAKTYVTDFPDKQDVDLLFSIVPGDIERFYAHGRR